MERRERYERQREGGKGKRSGGEVHPRKIVVTPMTEVEEASERGHKYPVFIASKQNRVDKLIAMNNTYLATVFFIVLFRTRSTYFTTFCPELIQNCCMLTMFQGNDLRRRT